MQSVHNMSKDIQKFLELQKELILAEKKRLGLLQATQPQDEQLTTEEKLQLKTPENKENISDTSITSCEFSPREPNVQKLPLIERLDLNSVEGNLDKDKQAFIDRLVNSENPLSFRSNEGSSSSMLRYGEYSPNNPQFRVAAAPYIGLGEYEQRKQLFSRQRKNDYLEHLSKQNEQIKNTAKKILLESRPVSTGVCKAVQTEIQNIHSKLVQYELHSQNAAEKELSPQTVVDNSQKNQISNCNDHKPTPVHNAFINNNMDKPKSILSKRSVSPRDRLSHYSNSYGPSFLDGFSYQDKSEMLEKERIKREAYQAELRQQIEEKRRMSAYREEQDRRAQELENRRLEQQLLRMQEEELLDQRRSRRDEQYRRNSDDYLRRKHDLQLQSLPSYRKHLDLDSDPLRNTAVASKSLSHYSPPVSRRNPYSLNIPSTSLTNPAYSDPVSRYSPGRRCDTFPRRDAIGRADSLGAYDGPRYGQFGRYDSLSRIDSLRRQDSLSRQMETLSMSDGYSGLNGGIGRQRRNSTTQQELGYSRRSPKLQRRSSSSRFDDPLPIPVLKARSPVAKELRNSVAVNSSRSSSDAVRRLEDKWQVPAVQRNILNHSELSRDGTSKSILTQLGAIRMQLQQEQLRMDDLLRQRGITQSKAVDFH